MFGIGLAELAVIAFFGVVVLGPDKLPGLAKQLAQGVKATKRLTDTVRDDLRSSLGDEYADLELTDLHPRALVRRHVLEALEADVEAEMEARKDADDDEADEAEHAAELDEADEAELSDLHDFAAVSGDDTEAGRDARTPLHERKTA